MAWFTIAAIYFVLWWLVLFAVMPFGFRSQSDAGEVTPGTVASAPARPHFAKAALRTTIVSAVLFAGFYYVVAVRGWGFADIPLIIPSEFRSNL
jgi:predicted secreted protein